MKGVEPMFKKIQKHASEVLEFPADVLDNGPRIIIMGRNKMTVEYFTEVVQFTNEEIILKTPVGRLKIQGQEFVLSTVLQTEIHLEGQIFGLSFEEG
jgi:sporulation protein YqfC